MFADDTSLTLSADDPAALEEKLNNNIDEVQMWLQSNKRTLNGKNTKYMIIGSQYRLRHLNEDLDIRVGDQKLTRATTYTYLGIEVDEALGWQSQADAVCKNVSAGLGAPKRIRSLVPRQTLLQMYEALVLPYLDYCSEVWGAWENASVTNSRDCKTRPGDS